MVSNFAYDLPNCHVCVGKTLLPLVLFGLQGSVHVDEIFKRRAFGPRRLHYLLRTLT